MSTITEPPAERVVPVRQLQYRLLSIWLYGGLATGVLLIVLTLSGRYESNADKVWSWFIPTIVPTLSLMIGVIAAEAMLPPERRGEHSVEQRFAGLATRLSCAYIVVLFGTIVATTIAAALDTSGEPKTAAEWLLSSNYWLAPFQAFAAVAIGAVFRSARAAKSGE